LGYTERYTKKQNKQTFAGMAYAKWRMRFSDSRHTLPLEVRPMNFNANKMYAEYAKIAIDIRTDSDSRDSERIQT
jgi:hypothetical protein